MENGEWRMKNGEWRMDGLVSKKRSKERRIRRDDMIWIVVK